MKKLLLTWGTLILASVALIQPWAFNLWNNVYLKGDIVITNTRFVDFESALAGPSITIYGSLLAVDKPVLINHAKVKFSCIGINGKEHPVRSFNWNMFKSTETVRTAQGITGDKTKIVSAFTVKPNQPYSYGILFTDKDVILNLQNDLDTFSNKWRNAMQDVPRPFGPSQGFGLPPQIKQQLDTKFLNLVEGELGSSITRRLQYVNPWQAGKYTMTIEFNSTNPERIFAESWTLDLSEEEVKKINNPRAPFYYFFSAPTRLPYPRVRVYY